MWALLVQPVTWAIAATGAFFGTLIDHKINDPVPAAYDTHSQSVDPNKIIFYAFAAIALWYGFKKVSRMK